MKNFVDVVGTALEAGMVVLVVGIIVGGLFL